MNNSYQNFDSVSDNSDVIFISDIRYDQYEKDEVYWIKNVLKGKLLHVSKYTYNDFDERVFTQPPNEHERINDPLVKLKSDVSLEWKQTEIKDTNLIENEYLNFCVSNCLQKLF